MTKGNKRAVVFIAAALAVAGVFAYSGWNRARALARYIENDYRYAFTDLVGHVVDIDSALTKGEYASSPAMLAQLATEVTRHASSAQINLSKLPFAFEELESTSKFLSQAGDYAFYISRRAASGVPMTKDEYETLRYFGEMSHKLAEDLTRLQMIINEENLKISKIIEAQSALGAEERSVFSLNESFKEFKLDFPETAVLLYDGPFSEHIEKREPVFLEDKEEIDSDTAKKRAAEFLEIPAGYLQYGGESNGRIAAYVFYGHLDGGELSVEISKLGGYVVGMQNSRTVGESRIGYEEGVQKALAFLNKKGFTGMRDSYYVEAGNVLTVNFAYEQDGVIIYPDLIKVGLALDSGAVVQYESAGYLMNHRERSVVAPRERDAEGKEISDGEQALARFENQPVTCEQARERLSAGLIVESCNLCVIPSPGENELACYEFQCVTREGRRLLIYVNVVSGVEEKIMLLIENDNGTLTI